MKLSTLRNSFLAAALSLAPSVLMAAAGVNPGPGPIPQPQVKPNPADVQVVWAGNNVILGTQGTLQLVVTVSDSQTGLPVNNLAKPNFFTTFAEINPVCASPTIKSVVHPAPGIYQLVMGFGPETLCTWKVAKYPIAFQILSTFNPLNPFAPASYQGQVSTLLEIH